MEVIAQIYKALGEKSGVTADGRAWKKAEYVLQTLDSRPKKMVMGIKDGTSGRIARLNLREGMIYKVFFDLDARDWQGKWFNELTIYDAREVNQ